MRAQRRATKLTSALLLLSIAHGLRIATAFVVGGRGGEGARNPSTVDSSTWIENGAGYATRRRGGRMTCRPVVSSTPDAETDSDEKTPPLIPFQYMQDDDDDDDDGGVAFDGDPAGVRSSFYDVDYDDDYEEAAKTYNAQNGAVEYPEGDGEFAGFTREEADILEEREDRLYTEVGRIERCVLVGVEDLSARRKTRKRRQQQQRDLYRYNSHSNSNNRYNTGSGGGGAYLDVADNDDDEDEDGIDEVPFTLDESLIEMRELIKTAGMEIAGEITQRLNEINPRTYVNTGKVSEANALLNELNCNTIVFDAELTPGQQKALENTFNKKLLQNDFLGSEREIKVIDRTALILDIFAQHAKTREGKLQVDLALHEYRKPRLTRMWTHLERQSGAGGVGLRGPGESQLEIDKRLVRDRIITLKQKIDDVQKQRTMRRRGRERMGLPILSLVGYTNAGKSSMLNFLTRSGVLAESMLFATLDPTTRKVKLPGFKTHPEVLLTDTVGFIQKLPTHLVAAFRATLEEVQEADLLVHVIDVSNPSWQKQEKSVQSVLADIGAADKPIVRVWNKIDLLDPLVADALKYEAAASRHTVAVSALTGDGMQDMVYAIEDALADLLVPIEVIIPYSKGDEMNVVHEQGNVEMVDYRENGTYVRALVPEAVANRLEQYSVNRHHQKQSALLNNNNPNKAPNDSEDEIDWVALGRGRHSNSDK